MFFQSKSVILTTEDSTTPWQPYDSVSVPTSTVTGWKRQQGRKRQNPDQVRRWLGIDDASWARFQTRRELAMRITRLLSEDGPVITIWWDVYRNVAMWSEDSYYGVRYLTNRDDDLAGWTPYLRHHAGI